MLMVIIGAGASYDSSPDKLPANDAGLWERPPLADNLFLDLGLRHLARSAIPQIHALIPELLPNLQRTLEQSLQRLQGEADANPRRHNQLLAVRYYLRKLFTDLSPKWLLDTGAVTNYRSLFDQISHHRKNYPGPVCLVTFNYDTLIEDALTRDFGMKFTNPDSYIADSRFQLFKLHGSQNWGRLLAGAIPTDVLSPPGSGPWGNVEKMISHAQKLLDCVSDEFSVVGTTAPSSSPSNPLYPAIAIPVLEKSAFECPTQHVDRLKSLIPKVKKILTIGWRGGEQHFLRLLGQMRAVQLVTVAGNLTEAQETLERLETSCGSTIKRGKFAGFSASVADRRFDLLLGEK